MIKKLACLILLLSSFSIAAQDSITPFTYQNVFDLQYISDPQISPDGKHVVYRRMKFDIMKDRKVGDLWIVGADGKGNQKLTSREASEFSPRWSPSGDRIAFASSTDEGTEVYMYWVDSGRIAKISQLPKSPGNLTWSPDGSTLAFTMMVPSAPPVLAKMPKKPKGAKWADSPRITDRLYHEADGRGYIEPGFTHIFTMPAIGGPARQRSSGDFHHRSNLSWAADGKSLYFSANRSPEWEYDFRNSEINKLELESGEITALTDRKGPDHDPQVSPDGKYLAYVGYEDKMQTYQVRDIHLMNLESGNVRVLTTGFDRSPSQLAWGKDNDGLYFSYDDKGNTRIGHVSLNGKINELARNLGGTSLGRPYGGGSFSVSEDGAIAFTQTRPEYPAELAVLSKRGDIRKITSLNRSLFESVSLGKVEEVWYKSSFDQRDIQGWVVYPPEYDANKKYPFLVENHGGPISNYGDRFSPEMQLYAAAGYIVFYPNPRGSTSYGEEFGNLLYHNYPGEDYLDVMDGVDHFIEKGIAHEDALFVTGGSAGGIMTAWMIGKNDRFEAAVVAKPVVNWISKTLVADNYFYYANTRYPGQPWENFETYWKFSPLSLVADIETPTMVMVGMDDLRTPPSEAKQLYHALKLRKVETVLVEIPGASHGIANKPSNLITKIAHTLAWFEKYRTDKEQD